MCPARGTMCPAHHTERAWLAARLSPTRALLVPVLEMLQLVLVPAPKLMLAELLAPELPKVLRTARAQPRVDWSAPPSLRIRATSECMRLRSALSGPTRVDFAAARRPARHAWPHRS